MSFDINSIFVPGEGPKDAKIVFIGEAPGTQEARLLRPFVGPSGQLFEDCLRKALINRKDCYVTNVIKEQPPGNNINLFIDLSKKTPKISTRAQEYLDILYSELNELSPNVLVPVGRIALFALTGLKEITKYRGSILSSNTQTKSRKTIPILHPASALREYTYRHLIFSDLLKIKEQSNYPEISFTPRTILTKPAYWEVINFLTTLKTYSYCCLDIEIFNNYVSCLSLGNDFVGYMSIPFMYNGSDYFTKAEEHEIWVLISDICADPKITKLGQNIIFDATFLMSKYGIYISPLADTMIAHGIAYPELPKGLDYLTSVYTDVPYYKDEGKKWFKLGEGSWESFWEYNAKDSAVLPEIHSKLVKTLEKQGNMPVYERTLRLVEPLIYMQQRGILVDMEGLTKANDKATEDLAQLNEEFIKECGFECNPQSPKQLKELFYEHRGHRPYVNRTSGTVTTNNDALKRLSRLGDNAAKILLKIRKLSKLQSTYYNIGIDPDNRLRCSYNPVGTSSGRLSSSQTIFGTGGNMQNLPPEFKKFLRFDPGYIGYQIDLSQAENRVVAYIAPDIMMQKAFEENLDVHSLTGSLISGLSYEEVKAQDKENIKCDIGGGVYSWRFWGKKANHGLNYGLGYKTFSFYYEIPENEARFIVNQYHKAYKGIQQFHSWVRMRLSRSRTLENCLGRKRLFLGRWGEELFKEAYSYIPQSTIAEKLNLDGVCFTYYNPNFSKVELLNQVHDSIWFQIPMSVPLETHAEIVLAIKSELESPLYWNNTSFSIPADVEAAVPGGNLAKYDPKTNPEGLRKMQATNTLTLYNQLRELAECCQNVVD